MDEQQYQEWLGNREEILEQLTIAVDEEIRGALDFTPASLAPVGAYLVETFASLNELHRPENFPVHLGFSTYAFEVFRRNLPLEPRLPLDEPGYEYYGIPVLTSAAGSDVCPFDLVTFTVHRREPDLLGRVFGNQEDDLGRRPQAPPTGDSASGPSAVSFEPMSDEDYNAWLTFVTDQLEGFLSGLDDATRHRFDFSPESLRFVGEIAVARAVESDGVFLQDSLFRDLYTYTGEVFHKNLGLQFFLPQEPDDPAYGHPSIRNPSGNAVSLPRLLLDTAGQERPELPLETFERVRDGWVLGDGES